MVGSSDSVAGPNTTLNAIVAESFAEAADRLENTDDFEMEVHDLIKEYLTDHQRIIFNGDGYSDEWVKEAERRGLPNIKSMVESVSALLTKKSAAMFEKFGIFTKSELTSRAEILYETYTKSINIEALTMLDMAGKQIIPAVLKYTGKLGEYIASVKAAGADTSVHADILKKCTSELSKMRKAEEKLRKDLDKANSTAAGRKKAEYYRDVICADMAALRAPADALEMMVEKDMWPFPTYGDILFEV